MKSISLNGQWNLAFTMPNGQNMTVPACVPGNVELDLERAGLTGNTIPVDCEYPERWIESLDWHYSRTFQIDEMPSHGREVKLRFDGIDTVADVSLNGIFLGHCENMFIPQEFDAAKALKPGENLLEVHITAPEIAARKYPLPPRVASNTSGASIYMRKARHHWGWDNAPRRLTSGLWRDVTLEFPDDIRFTRVYVYTERVFTDKNEAEIGCTFSFATPDRDLSAYQIILRLEKDGESVLEFTRNVLHNSVFMRGIMLKDIKFWWPAGYGTPELYDFSLTLTRNGIPVARHRHAMGIRRFLLDRTETTTPAGDGEFQLYCNNEKIYIRGTNWKPLSPFPSQTPQKLERALQLVEECNCNLIRVWGGGVYEGHDFFDWCDRHGIMVWQDFMMACECPPQDKFYLDAMQQEAESIVIQLRNHPSLALWCGDNECDELLSWGSLAQRNLMASHNRITREILPRVIFNLDPARDFLPSSPYLADEILAPKRHIDQPVNILHHAPEQHVYCKEITQGGFREYFRRSAAHLISETGPFYINALSESPEILEADMKRLHRLWNTPSTRAEGDDGGNHQSDLYCTLWIEWAKTIMKLTYGIEITPDRPEELIDAVNYYVADAFKIAIEDFRQQKFRRTGIVWWSLLDMWPMGFNYSAVDSAFKPKLPFLVSALSQQPLALMAMDAPGNAALPHLHAVNDTLNEYQGTYRITDLDGNEVDSGTFQVSPNAVADLGEINVAPADFVLLHWQCGELKGKNYFMRDGSPFDLAKCRKMAKLLRNGLNN